LGYFVIVVQEVLGVRQQEAGETHKAYILPYSVLTSDNPTDRLLVFSFTVRPYAFFRWRLHVKTIQYGYIDSITYDSGM